DAATHSVERCRQINNLDEWSDWENLGGNIASGLTVARNKDGHLDVFGIDAGGGLYHCWQLRTNTSAPWSQWVNLGGAILPGMGTGQNAAGRLEVFGVNRTNGAVNRICQSTPGDSTEWSAWSDF